MINAFLLLPQSWEIMTICRGCARGRNICSVPLLFAHSADLRSFCGRGVTEAIRQACAVKRYLKAESSPVGQIEFYMEPWDL